jgi:hypothetical protein
LNGEEVARPASELATGRSRIRPSGAALAALVLATAVLFQVSRGKWSDAIIDSGREWIVPDALSRGALLYRDVVYWFGPFTPYLHAAVFKVFGSSFSSLVLAGILGAAAVLASLFIALRQVSGRAEAALWTALAVPALVFMPNAGGAILGMGFRMWHAAAFSLLAIAAASGRDRSWLRPAGAGALAALAGLCRTEWGLAALSAAALTLGLSARRRERARPFAALLGGFAVAFGSVWAFFFLRVGWHALVVDQPVFLLHIPEETRDHVGLAGFAAWRTGLWNVVYSSCMWLGLYLAVRLVLLRNDGSGRTRRRLGLLAGVLILAAVAAAWGGASGPVVLAGAPLLCVAALVEGWRRSPAPEGCALAGLGWMGLVSSHRRVFFIGDAPYVAPPLLLAFACAAGLVALGIEATTPPHRVRFGFALRLVLGLLVVLAFAVRFRAYEDDDRVAIAGTGGMLTERPETAKQIEQLAATIRSRTGPGEGLVVIPEGEILNFLADRPNPLRHKLYLPGYLSSENEADVLAELSRTRPSAIVVWFRTTGEYGQGSFGSGYGRRLAAWIGEEYAEETSPGPMGNRSAPRVFWSADRRLSRGDSIGYPVGARTP